MSHYEDEAQVEQLRQWWRENWMALAGGLVLGLGGIFGWEAWQGHQTGHAEEASQMYEDLKRVPAEDLDKASPLAKRLMEDFGNTPYAAQGALLMAGRAAAKDDWARAESSLRWARDHADDAGLRKIATLRLARVLWQEQKAADALGLLAIEDGDAFAALYRELAGDIKLSQGDREAARAEYAKALAANPAPASRAPLQRKLDDLGAGTAEPADATAKS